jgi:hypothetical protein
MENIETGYCKLYFYIFYEQIFKQFFYHYMKSKDNSCLSMATTMLLL